PAGTPEREKHGQSSETDVRPSHGVSPEDLLKSRTTALSCRRRTPRGDRARGLSALAAGSAWPPGQQTQQRSFLTAPAVGKTRRGRSPTWNGGATVPCADSGANGTTSPRCRPHGGDTRPLRGISRRDQSRRPRDGCAAAPF